MHYFKGLHNRLTRILTAVLAFIVVASFAFAITADACTALYVGSDVSADGTTVIARSADTHPATTSVYLKVTESSESRGQTVTGNNGFSWTLPNKTYKFVSSPRPATIEKGENWDSEAINECGLAVTATLTAYSCDAAIAADPYVKDGLSEDNITGIVAASCGSAREGIELLASIIDEKGSAEPNILLVADQNEAWYMEIYTGHQYAAVKMPDDAVAVVGNEFMLDTLDGFDCITSDKLFTLAEENNFAKKQGQSVDLFKTYVEDNRHPSYGSRRVWRGHQLFSPSSTKEYNYLSKSELFFAPEEKLSTSAMIDFFRDRYEGVEKKEKIEEGGVRVIATETASQVHVLKVHKDLPAALAVEEWFCDSNSAYAPFVPLSNIISDVSESYKYVVQSYGLDENSAAHVYKELNALAAQNRERYGLNVEAYWQDSEARWEEEFRQVLDAAEKKYESGDEKGASRLLTNYTEAVQNEAYADASRIYNDLTWFIMENTDTLSMYFNEDELIESKEPFVYSFMPRVNLGNYAESYGWETEFISSGEKSSESDKTGSVAAEMKLSMGSTSVDVTSKDEKRTSKGKLSTGSEEVEINAVSDGVNMYVPLSVAEKYFRQDKIADVDISRYESAEGNAVKGTVPTVPIAIAVLIIAAAIILIIKNKKNKKKTEPTGRYSLTDEDIIIHRYQDCSGYFLK